MNMHFLWTSAANDGRVVGVDARGCGLTPD